MKVLVISTNSGKGPGGVMGGYRLLHGLKNEKGVDVKLLAGKVDVSGDAAAEIIHNTLLEKVLSRFTMPLGLHYIHYYSTFSLNKYPFFKWADVVNYHSVHGGYFNYLAFPKLTKAKPSVYTLHDMWALTGHCITSYGCERWKTGCGHCPHLEVHPAVKVDNTRTEWKLKKWAYEKSNMHIVTPSRWLFNEAKQSILGQLPIHHIPNGIDVTVFQPRGKEECREILGVKKNKKVLLFSAFDLSKTMKGGDLIINIINKLPREVREESVLLLMGNNGDKIIQAFNTECIDLGFVSGDVVKSIVFSAADLFIYPTRADNLPYIVQESLACGTPVVSFDVGGVSDLVREAITGSLVEPFNLVIFADKVNKLLNDDLRRAEMSRNARAIAVDEYSIELQTKNYLNLYQSIL